MISESLTNGDVPNLFGLLHETLQLYCVVITSQTTFHNF